MDYRVENVEDFTLVRYKKGLKVLLPTASFKRIKYCYKELYNFAVIVIPELV